MTFILLQPDDNTPKTEKLRKHVIELQAKRKEAASKAKDQPQAAAASSSSSNPAPGPSSSQGAVGGNNDDERYPEYEDDISREKKKFKLAGLATTLNRSVPFKANKTEEDERNATSLPVTTNTNPEATETEAVSAVMDSMIHEFVQLTKTDDIDKAKDFLSRSNYVVDAAVQLYIRERGSPGRRRRNRRGSRGQRLALIFKI